MIRNTVSEALGISISKNSWASYIDYLDREGTFSRKNQLRLFVVLCEAVEALEMEMQGKEHESNPTKKRLQPTQA